jgi:hypothetical protein
VTLNDGQTGANEFRVKGNVDSSLFRVIYSGVGADTVAIGQFLANSGAKLEVNGSIKLGSSGATTVDGIIRWTGTDYEGYITAQGGWKSLTGGGGGGGNAKFVITAGGANTGGNNDKNLFFGINNADGPMLIPANCNLLKIGFSLNQVATAGTSGDGVELEYSVNGGAFQSFSNIVKIDRGAGAADREYVLVTLGTPLAFTEKDRLQLRSSATNMSPTSAEPTAILYFQET